MAGDWIKMRRGLRHDPKVIAMARHLENSPNFTQSCVRDVTCGVTLRITFACVTRVTVCALLDVWASLNTTLGENGKAPFMRLQDIDDIAEIPGFGEAMKSVAWVKELDDQSLEFPNFSENNSPSKSRDGNAKSGAERAKEYRARKKAEQSKNGTVTPSRNVTVDKIREDKSTSTKVDVSDLPFSSADFVRFWENWEQHRKEKKAKLTPTAIKQQLEKLKGMGEQRAIAALKHSLANGYTGIFEPDLFNSEKQTTHKGIQEKIELKRL